MLVLESILEESLPMRVMRFVLAAASAAVMAVGLGGPLSAYATETPDVSDIIEFTGSANAAVPWIGGGGPTACPSYNTSCSYNFTSTSCTLAWSDPSGDNGDGSLGIESLLTGYGCSVGLSSGNYVNLVCGTGLANGNAGATINETGADGGDTLTLGPYTIIFVGGQGILEATGTDTGTSGSGPEAVLAVVDIAPVGLNPLSFPTGQCVTGFNVTGVGAALDITPA